MHIKHDVELSKDLKATYYENFPTVELFDGDRTIYIAKNEWSALINVLQKASEYNANFPIQHDPIKERFPNKYNGIFESNAVIASQFQIPVAELADMEIIYANYECEDYSGRAIVLFLSYEDDLYYEVHGSHCSCNGLEDQWEPELIGTAEQFIEYIKHVNYKY